MSDYFFVKNYYLADASLRFNKLFLEGCQNVCNNNYEPIMKVYYCYLITPRKIFKPTMKFHLV